jgi:hypothetical protein
MRFMALASLISVASTSVTTLTHQQSATEYCFHKLALLPQSRLSHGAVAIGSDIYLIGGYVGANSTATASIDVYHTSNNS